MYYHRRLLIVPLFLAVVLAVVIWRIATEPTASAAVRTPVTRRDDAPPAKARGTSTAARVVASLPARGPQRIAGAHRQTAPVARQAGPPARLLVAETAGHGRLVGTGGPPGTPAPTLAGS